MNRLWGRLLAMHCRVSTWMGGRLWVGKPSRYVTSHLGQLSLPSLWLGLRQSVFTCVGWQGVIPYGKWHSVAQRWSVINHHQYFVNCSCSLCSVWLKFMACSQVTLTITQCWHAFIFIVQPLNCHENSLQVVEEMTLVAFLIVIGFGHILKIITGLTQG